jgi:hypothetical protein
MGVGQCVLIPAKVLATMIAQWEAELGTAMEQFHIHISSRVAGACLTAAV